MMRKKEDSAFHIVYNQKSVQSCTLNGFVAASCHLSMHACNLSLFSRGLSIDSRAYVISKHVC